MFSEKVFSLLIFSSIGALNADVGWSVGWLSFVSFQLMKLMELTKVKGWFRSIRERHRCIREGHRSIREDHRNIREVQLMRVMEQVELMKLLEL